MNKKYLIGGIIVVVLVLGFFMLQQNSTPSDSSSGNSTPNQLSPVSSITHGHGLSVDVEDPSKVYTATNNGLFLLMNDQDLFKVGSAGDDYMGFSPHPTNSKVFFSSGHPSTGGNNGFQKSEDGGFSWKKVSTGINGPVDFHAMTVSPANPNLIYGWFRGGVPRSIDEGKNWEKTKADFSGETPLLISFSKQSLPTSDGKQNTETIYLLTAKNSLFKTSDGGSSWSKVS